jgi:cell pole-organizing protein PopZ
MSEPKAQGQEPTMEEILASIRRIISENDDPAAAPAKAPPGKGAGAQQSIGDDGVLELTDVVGSDGKVVNIAAAKATTPVTIPEPRTTEEPPMAEPTPDPVARPKPIDVPVDDVELAAVEPTLRTPRTAGEDDALVGAAAATVSTSAFAALAHELSRKNGGDTTTGSLPIGSGRTLEDLVKEMIRPMLREWLDANLPGMVERMVKREIERLVHRAEE